MDLVKHPITFNTYIDVNYYSNLYLPSISKEVQVYEIKYGDYCILQKFIIGNSNDTILLYLDFLIKKYIKTPARLSALDKFICLLFQRIISLHADLEMSTDSKSMIKIDLNKILNSLLDFQTNIQNTKIMQEPFTLNYPALFSYETRVDYIYGWINNIEDEDASVYSILKTKIDIIESRFSKIDLFLPKVENESLTLNFSNGVLLELLKLYLKSNLMEIYDRNHFLLSKANHTLSDLNQLSPAEVNVYAVLIEKELKAIAESTSDKTKSIPLTPQV